MCIKTRSIAKKYPKVMLYHGRRMTLAEYNIRIRADWYEWQQLNKQQMIQQQLVLL